MHIYFVCKSKISSGYTNASVGILYEVSEAKNGAVKNHFYLIFNILIRNEQWKRIFLRLTPKMDTLSYFSYHN